MPEPRNALDGASSGQRIRILEIPDAGSIVQVSAFHGQAPEVAEALGRSTGVRAPLDVGGTVERDGFAILSVGPGRWWLIGDPGPPLEIDPAEGAIVDQSHGRVVLEVAGDGVRDLLAKGTSIDLHPTVMPAGRCAATALGHIAVVLHARADDRFEVHVARSYARALFEWLADAALEFEDSARA